MDHETVVCVETLTKQRLNRLSPCRQSSPSVAHPMFVRGFLCSCGCYTDINDTGNQLAF